MIRTVIASEFATDEDLVAYRRAKAQGKTDEEAFKVGDNCIGAWGDPTNSASEPMCALPPEHMEETWGVPWRQTAHRKRVLITNLANSKNVIALVMDRMPYLAHITNGAAIDLNPAAVHALGLPYGAMKRVTWGPVEDAAPA